MRKAIIFSGIFHVVLLLAVLVSFDWWSDDEREEIISVQLVEFDDLTDEPVVEEVAEEIIEPELEPDVEPEPEPEPVKEPVAELPPPVAEEAPPPVAELEVIPAPEVAPKAPPVRVTKDIPNLRPLDKPKTPSKFDKSRIAALLDKREREDAPKPPPVKVEKEVQPVKRSQIEQARVTASIQAAIKSQVESCWNAPIGASYAETLIVEIRINLRPDGTLIGAPKILDENRMKNDSFFRVAAEAARRAVQRCASRERPLKLPREEYEIWRDVVLKFDPSKVF
ncbi:MAG: hypothetical protein O2910_04750 [Proteobacteria bacterium]|nr:hypothetical protein [Pseudomonadota bacterium]